MLLKRLFVLPVSHPEITLHQCILKNNRNNLHSHEWC